MLYLRSQNRQCLIPYNAEAFMVTEAGDSYVICIMNDQQYVLGFYETEEEAVLALDGIADVLDSWQFVNETLIYEVK